MAKPRDDTLWDLVLPIEKTETRKRKLTSPSGSDDEGSRDPHSGESGDDSDGDDQSGHDSDTTISSETDDEQKQVCQFLIIHFEARETLVPTVAEPSQNQKTDFKAIEPFPPNQDGIIEHSQQGCHSEKMTYIHQLIIEC